MFLYSGLTSNTTTFGIGINDSLRNRTRHKKNESNKEEVKISENKRNIQQMNDGIDLPTVDHGLDPSHAWFTLAGRPDFRPAASRQLGIKRQHLDNASEELRFFDGITKDGKQHNFRKPYQYSWRSWYDWNLLDNILAEKSPEFKEKLLAYNSLVDDLCKPSTELSLRSKPVKKCDIVSRFANERNETIAFEEAISRLLK